MNHPKEACTPPNRTIGSAYRYGLKPASINHTQNEARKKDKPFCPTHKPQWMKAMVDYGSRAGMAGYHHRDAVATQYINGDIPSRRPFFLGEELFCGRTFHLSLIRR
jgi:hypothetical protein